MGGKSMFKFRDKSDRIRESEKETLKAQQEARQTRADLEFVACMCDVEIPSEEEDEEL